MFSLRERAKNQQAIDWSGISTVASVHLGDDGWGKEVTVNIIISLCVSSLERIKLFLYMVYVGVGVIVY